MTSRDFDPHDREFLADPYRVYARLRSESPVRQRSYESGWRAFDLTRHTDVTAALRDPRLRTVNFHPELVEAVLQDPSSPFYTLARIVKHVLLVRDGDDHRRLRGLINRAFTPRIVEQLELRIQELVAELLREPLARGDLDIIADLAAPLPIVVIAELLGLPPEDRDRLKAWSDATATFIDGTLREAGLPEAAAAATELGVYLDEVFAARRAEPRADLISALVQAHERDDRLSEDELLATVWLVLAAGHETTTNLIGNGMLALLTHPDQYALLSTRPELIESAVEELLRFDAPVQATSRIATVPMTIGDVEIPQGSEVMTFLGAANRDPEVFEEPDRLDVTRRDNRHVSFGHGVHFCLGAFLARLEAKHAIGALSRQLPTLALADEELEWRPGIILRGLRRLRTRTG